MEDAQITITKVTFDAFGRECSETFYDTDIKKCKSHIWQFLCNTAVFKKFEIRTYSLIIKDTQVIDGKDLRQLRYIPQVIDLGEMIKQKNKGI